METQYLLDTRNIWREGDKVTSSEDKKHGADCDECCGKDMKSVAWEM